MVEKSLRRSEPLTCNKMKKIVKTLFFKKKNMSCFEMLEEDTTTFQDMGFFGVLISWKVVMLWAICHVTPYWCEKPSIIVLFILYRKRGLYIVCILYTNVDIFVFCATCLRFAQRKSKIF